MASIINDKPVKIFGARGTIRDYVYVTDLAEGIVSALEYGLLSETYNIGSGVGRTNMDVVAAISPLLGETGSEIKIEHLPERVFDVQANILDSTKLNSHTGWVPKIEFQDGLLKTRDWLKDRLG
jgi:UDP-glucose 4-epimerase